VSAFSCAAAQSRAQVGHLVQAHSVRRCTIALGWHQRVPEAQPGGLGQAPV
jgi:hypothetical protein